MVLLLRKLQGDLEDNVTVTPTISSGAVSPEEPTEQVPGTPAAKPTGQLSKIPTRPIVIPTVRITAPPTSVKAPKVQKVSGLKVSTRKKVLTVRWKKCESIWKLENDK